MVRSQSRIDRLRREADTVFTRIETVEAALADARERDGDHWEDGLELSLETPDGEPIRVTLDVTESAAENGQRRYERAATLQAELDERRDVAGDLAVLPPDPVAVLVLSRLAAEGAATSRAVAGDLNVDHDRVHELCSDLAATELVATRGKDGGVTRYRLTDDGGDLWDHLDTKEGKATLLDLHEEMATLAGRLHSGGPDYPQLTAADLGMDRGHVRHLYAAMDAVGLVEPYEGSIIKGSERKLKPKDETHKKHTYYETTTVAERILRARE